MSPAYSGIRQSVLGCNQLLSEWLLQSLLELLLLGFFTASSLFRLSSA